MSEQVKDSWISVMHGGAGWFAVHMVVVEDSEIGKYQDVQQTGVGRYATKEMAVSEARAWAEAENIRLSL